jgi:hypothetical protein
VPVASRKPFRVTVVIVLVLVLVLDLVLDLVLVIDPGWSLGEKRPDYEDDDEHDTMFALFFRGLIVGYSSRQRTKT